MKLDQFGLYQPDFSSFTKKAQNSDSVCPFSDESLNEDQIRNEHYSDLPYNEIVGAYHQLQAGHVVDNANRLNSSSGGILTWLGKYLLTEQFVDFVVHVGPGEGDKMYQYQISTTPEEIGNGSKSKYYPVELSEVLGVIRNSDQTCAVFALPCFAKALRNLVKLDKAYQGKIQFIIGLICGHLKSKNYAEFLAAQVGCDVEETKTVDFRVKYPNGNASQYGFSVQSKSNNTDTRMKNVFGGNWGLNLFRNPSCNYCDDVFAECADLAVGDAWLPRFLSDPMGNSLVVSRNERLSEILFDGVKRGELNLEALGLDDVIQSQSGGIRDRREGLGYRLSFKKKSKEWVPQKRSHLLKGSPPFRRRRLYRWRMRLGDECHQVWKNILDSKTKDPVADFREWASSYERKIQFFSGPLWKGILRPIKRQQVRLRNRLRSLTRQNQL